jgi:predicted nucleic acid-binding Zn ribbon protein
MSTKHKPSKQEVQKRDQEENRKFMMVLAIATAVLVIIMYLIFA